MIIRRLLGCSLVLGLIAAGCGDGSVAEGPGGSGGSGGTGGSGPRFTPPEYDTWVKYEPEGATCSDGSPYKFWVEFSETSDNVIIFFEGGGACWDYESCSGNSGIRGAANPNGLPDTHADAQRNVEGIDVGAREVYPLLNQDPNVSPMADWNKVFVPYCTGDIWAGTKTETYPNPNEGEPDLEFRHVGHLNILKMTEMLDEMFSTVPKLFVSGCSAGGVGALVNYYFLRTGITGVEKGYLLDDSGPAFPSKEPTSRSLPLYDTIRPSWGVDSLIDSAPQAETLRDDFGQLAAVLADEFPNDRLATTFFRMDYNFSLYSYERFYELDGEDIMPYTGAGLGLDQHNSLNRAAVHSLFWDDIPLLRDLAATKSNLGYYIPFYRDTNSSHCVTIPGFEDVPLEEALVLFLNDFGTLAWKGSEIEADDIDLRDYVEHLLNDDEPLESYFEDDAEGHYLACAPDTYNASDCEAAVCERLSPERQIEQGCPD